MMKNSKPKTQNSNNEVKPLRLYNTMTQKKEIFAPVAEDKLVRMYNCGPTVYDFQHIGNLRAYVFADVLRRTLKVNSFQVKQVINITDVGHLVSDGDTGEDKMTKGLKREGEPITLEAMKKLGERYTAVFKQDLKKLNIKLPDELPRASDHIDEDIALIEVLESKGFTYEIDDGIYFDTKKLDDYGKLVGGIDPDDNPKQRIKNKQKKNPRDFALWKFDNKLGWESPWGKGFPGWHIECSVMSQQYLGDSFDIHTGGVDHIPVHHTNEIAQSEAATDNQMARFWLHNEFLTISGEKISKSIGNTLHLKTLEEKGYRPLDYRYFLLTAHYRKQTNLSWQALDSAKNALNRLYHFIRTTDYENGTVNDTYKRKFITAINDDLNTPQALAVVWELFGDENVVDADKVTTLFELDQVLGLSLSSPPVLEIPTEVKELVDKREQARADQNFEKADKLREKIKKLGFAPEDTQDGTQIVPYFKPENSK